MIIINELNELKRNDIQQFKNNNQIKILIYHKIFQIINNNILYTNSFINPCEI